MSIVLITFSLTNNAQELFVMTEPASNMPAKSIAIRSMNSFMLDNNSNTNTHFMPEIMWGINKNWMLHLLSFISDRARGGYFFEGASVYGKYRFYSKDDIHSHFRVAAYSRLSANRATIHQEEIETMGHNTGGELGMIATQLVKKLAISTSVSYERATNNLSNNLFPGTQSKHATNYTLSLGRLMHPSTYKSLKQTNVNLMVEFLGQVLNDNRKSYLDIIPSVQFILWSRARIDIAYRKQLYSFIDRTATSGLIVKLEYNFFNAYK